MSAGTRAATGRPLPERRIDHLKWIRPEIQMLRRLMHEQSHKVQTTCLRKTNQTFGIFSFST